MTLTEDSHLLARLGRAERIGNLVGQFEFTSMNTCLWKENERRLT